MSQHNAYADSDEDLDVEDAIPGVALGGSRHALIWCGDSDSPRRKFQVQSAKLERLRIVPIDERRQRRGIIPAYGNAIGARFESEFRAEDPSHLSHDNGSGLQPSGSR